jgi:NADP-dependent 3-hydroxy acid dehydrogenase YdfG
VLRITSLCASYSSDPTVTGCSSGFGKDLTEAVLAKGERVVATLRKPEVLASLAQKYSKEQLLILPVDVRNHEQIANAFDELKRVFGRLDVVVNNAGYGLLGEVEGTDDATARNLFDVLFWGAVDISRKV